MAAYAIAADYAAVDIDDAIAPRCRHLPLMLRRQIFR